MNSEKKISLYKQLISLFVAFMVGGLMTAVYFLREENKQLRIQLNGEPKNEALVIENRMVHNSVDSEKEDPVSPTAKASVQSKIKQDPDNYGKDVATP